MGHLKVPRLNRGDDDDDDDDDDDIDLFDDELNRSERALHNGAINTSTLVFDTLIARILRLISKLKLGEISNVNSNDGTLTLRPINVVDMDIFLNLCKKREIFFFHLLLLLLIVFNFHYFLINFLIFLINQIIYARYIFK